MDSDLKQHFSEFRTFVVETLGGVEKRLNARIDGLAARIDSLDAKVDGLDAKVDTLLSRVPGRHRAVRKR